MVANAGRSVRLHSGVTSPSWKQARVLCAFCLDSFVAGPVEVPSTLSTAWGNATVMMRSRPPLQTPVTARAVAVRVHHQVALQQVRVTPAAGEW